MYVNKNYIWNNKDVLIAGNSDLYRNSFQIESGFWYIADLYDSQKYVIDIL